MKRLFLVLAFILFVLDVSSQDPFLNPNYFNLKGNLPYDFIEGDIEGDGDIDLIQVQAGEPNLIFFEKAATGNYIQHNYYDIPMAYLELGSRAELFDFDLDGDLDIAIRNGSALDIYEFTDYHEFSYSSSLDLSGVDGIIKYFKFADFNGDGIDDIYAYTSSPIAKHYCLLSTGISTYDSPVLLGSARALNSPTYELCEFIADIDGDGDDDIINMSLVEDEIYTFLNDGLGNFSAKTILIEDVGTSYFLLQDFNLDGLVDIYAGSSGIYLNTLGSFSSLGLILFDGSWANVISIEDVNNDGYIDYIVSMTPETKIFFGDGSYSLTGGLTISEMMYNYPPLFFNDDLDLDKEIVICELNQLKKVDVTGGVITETYPFLYDLDKFTSLDVGDVDGDGVDDIIMGSSDVGGIGLYLNDGTAAFNFSLINSDLILGLKLIDINNDGFEDVFYSEDVSGDLIYLENDGTGSFLSPVNLGTGFANVIEKSDLDGDGDLDLVFSDNLSSGGSTTELYLMENIGGSLGAPVLISSISINDILIYDFEGDGLEDIFIGNESGLFKLVNEGTLTFSLPSDISGMPTEVNCLEISDIDNDGDLDLIGGYSDLTCKYLLNDGSGVFDSPELLTITLDDVSDVNSVDFNLDGEIDFIITTDTSINYLENNGFMSFDPIVEMVIFANSYRTISSDFDSDGDRDFVFMSKYGTNGWFENIAMNEINFSGLVYVDENENGIHDAGELTIDYAPLDISPSTEVFYSGISGEYTIHFDADAIGTYEITPNEPSGWYITSTPSSYSFVNTGSAVDVTGNDFGLYFTGPEELGYSTGLDLGFAPCNSATYINFNLANEGTTTPSGYIELILPDSLYYLASSITPDLIVGTTYTWYFTDLGFFEDFNNFITIETPGVDALGVVDDIIVNYYFYAPGTTTVEETATEIIEWAHACSYDPNDKIVTPAGYGPEGYIHPSTEELKYTIRFQNTGTAPAEDVEIKDQLNPNLDWSSLSYVSASDQVDISIDGTGEVTFRFEDVFLPDTGVSFEESQGFITFKIKLNEDIPLGTEITNFAEIYFDLNPPIITNTVLNTVDICFMPLTAEINAFTNDSLSIDDEAITLPGAIPTGGVYSGPGVSGISFDPNVAGEGEHEIIYTYTDVDGCTATDTIIIWVIDYTGLGESKHYGITVYPNPLTEYTLVNFGVQPPSNAYIVVYNMLGNEVYRINEINQSTIKLNREDFNQGMYILKVASQDNEKIYYQEKIIVQ